jgi:hypothetical protein
MREWGAMARVVRRATDLPSWFNLKSYSQAESLDAAGWYEQLAVRKWLLKIIDWRNEDKELFSSTDMETLSFIRSNPIVDVTANLAMRVYFYDGAMHEHRTEQPNYSLGVRLSTVRDFYLVEGNVEPEKREYAHRFFAQIFAKEDDWLEGAINRQFPCTDWIDKPINSISNQPGSAINVHVDLCLPDKVLIEQFKSLLRSQRRTISDDGIGLALNRRANFEDWISFGVLPFIDLKIWERESSIKIPNRVMADAIFPPGEGGEEIVRKTTSKIAKELMADGNLKFLAALASQRIVEANSG